MINEWFLRGTLKMMHITVGAMFPHEYSVKIKEKPEVKNKIFSATHWPVLHYWS